MSPLASRAVFLSYASQDAEAAQRICEALRNAGIEVWFDQSELRGGDAWDRSIRKHIKTCVLFIPVISENTHDRDEGYFRLEWKLAVDRSHLMTGNRAFLLPVVIDDARDDDENVPDRFREVQWTRLPGGQTAPAFVERVQRLVSPEASTTSQPWAIAAPSTISAPKTPVTLTPRWSKPVVQAAAAALVLAALGYFVADKFWTSIRGSASPTPLTTAPTMAAPAPAAAAAFNPPPHSVAVLPFVNMSGDKNQEYFSDGLTEELLNSLSRINEVQVAARTSSFSFQGEHPDIATVAHKLNVGAVLEGSVRRSGKTVRVTAQLINGVTGFHLWSQTYDRSLGDVLQLQTDIATAVASALKVTLLGDEAAKIQVGGTRDPAAFDAYLRASKAAFDSQDKRDLDTAITSYTEAIRLDPNYALAFAGRALARYDYAFVEMDPDYREDLRTVQADALKALRIAPNLAEGHLALAKFLHYYSLDFQQAREEYERAATLAPGNATVLRNYGRYAVFVGHTAAGLAASRRAVVLDPLNRENHIELARGLYFARQYRASLSAFQDAVALDSDYSELYGFRGLTYYALGDFENARASCETKADKPMYEWVTRPCLAITYAKLGKRADAQAMLAKEQSEEADADAYQYAEVYAQWGEIDKSLESLDVALRRRDAGLAFLKVDPLLDPLRNEPRFQAIERALKFPQ